MSNLIGITLTPNASMLLHSLTVPVISDVLKVFFVPYDVTKKTGVEKSCDVLNWPGFVFKDIPDNIEIIKNNLKFRIDESINYDVYMKFKNTMQFCNYVSKSGRREFTEYMNSVLHNVVPSNKDT